MQAAREAALAALAAHRPAATAVVEYASHGRLLLVTEAATLAQAVGAACTYEGTAVVWAVGSAPVTVERRDGVAVAHGGAAAVDGHLGAFHARLSDGSDLAAVTGGDGFDVIADFCTPPLLQRLRPAVHVLPPGYFAVADNTDALAEACAMKGVFQKPRYFAYDEKICAHAASQITACSRCIDACPTAAISDAGDKVHFNPALCQGCGVCATTCPTGAVRYAYPPPADTLEALRKALAVFRAEAGEAAAPFVVFHTAESYVVRDAAAHVLPVAVEEVGAVGAEVWLGVLARGAAGAAVVLSASAETALRTVVEAQCELVNQILGALGYPDDRVRVVMDDAAAALGEVPTEALCVPAAFAGENDKRAALFDALDHLAARAPTAATAPLALAPGAAFGAVEVDTAACTLCMTCAGLCPASALVEGGEVPALSFVEQNCVQCGLCAQACPEDAVTLRPRFLFDRAERRAKKILCEDKPFCCPSCGKPFATERVLARIEEKLKSHWMFQNEAAARRLRLCENCRVNAMFAEEGGLANPHKK